MRPNRRNGATRPRVIPAMMAMSFTSGHRSLERLIPDLTATELIDGEALGVLECANECGILTPVVAVVSELRQVGLALADGPAAADELLWQRLEPLLVVLSAPLFVLVEAGMRTVGTVLWSDVVTLGPGEVVARAGRVAARLGRLRLRILLELRLPGLLPCAAVVSSPTRPSSVTPIWRCRALVSSLVSEPKYPSAALPE